VVDSVRERKKAERRRRVLEAAREVFRERGYDAATTREIAARADVAVGTVFVYAHDKRDLLMTIVNDDLEAVTDASFAALRDDDAFIEKLLALFEPRYRYWVRDPALSSFALHETAAARVLEVASETERFHRRRWRILDKIVELIGRERAQGRMATDDDAHEVALYLMGIYLAHARLWLSDHDPDVADGMARLRRQFEFAMRGLDPSRRT
jgi:AcrR family transcriptional regulator